MDNNPGKGLLIQIEAMTSGLLSPESRLNVVLSWQYIGQGLVYSLKHVAEDDSDLPTRLAAQSALELIRKSLEDGDSGS